MEKPTPASCRLDGDSRTANIMRSSITSYLLLGSSSQTEIAVLKAIECWNPDSGEPALVQRAVEASLRSFDADSGAEQTESFNAETWLPVELLPVFRLPRTLRICYVLRVLAGLPAELCDQITGIEPSRVDRLAVIAMASFSNTHKVPKEKKGQTRPMYPLNVDQIRQLAYRLWQERGCPADSPNDDWFRAEDKLRQAQLTTEPPLFALATGPAEE